MCGERYDSLRSRMPLHTLIKHTPRTEESDPAPILYSLLHTRHHALLQSPNNKSYYNIACYPDDLISPHTERERERERKKQLKILAERIHFDVSMACE
jgi:hypothetical protein